MQIVYNYLALNRAHDCEPEAASKGQGATLQEGCRNERQSSSSDDVGERYEGRRRRTTTLTRAWISAWMSVPL